VYDWKDDVELCKINLNRYVLREYPVSLGSETAEVNGKGPTRYLTDGSGSSFVRDLSFRDTLARKLSSIPYRSTSVAGVICPVVWPPVISSSSSMSSN